MREDYEYEQVVIIDHMSLIDNPRYDNVFYIEQIKALSKLYNSILHSSQNKKFTLGKLKPLNIV
jgi:hypothetical protein